MAKVLLDIPFYEAVIDGEDCGMTCVSLVDRPAVESDFQKFAEDAQPMRYAVADEEKHLVWGVLMRADFPIYRRDDEMGEFYITYSAETVRKMAEKYLAQGLQNAVSLMHDGNEIEGVEMVQLCIKDSERGVVPTGFDEIEEGSLFAEFHVLDDEVWSAIKDGTYKGFSIECLVRLKKCDSPKKDNNSKHNFRMDKVKEAVRELFKLLCKFGHVVTDKAVLAWDGEEELKVGDEVFVEDEEGNRNKPEDGEYRTEDKKVIVVTEGKVSEIKDAEAPAEGGEGEGEGAEGGETKPQENAGEGEGEGEGEGKPAEGEGEGSDKTKALEERVAELESIVKKIADMFGIIIIEQRKMAEKPAVPSVVEEFKHGAVKPEKTGDKRLDNLMEKLFA